MSASNTQQDEHNEGVVDPMNNAAPLPGVDEIGEERTSNDGTTGAVKPHWRVPATMVLTLLSGVSLALGHHLFYAQYHGKPVHVSIGQQWVNRIGTGFAFMVQMLLVMTAGSAYVQRQWLSLGSRTHRIDQVDSMFGVLGDVTLFFDKVWVTNVLLALLAGITWCVSSSKPSDSERILTILEQVDTFRCRCDARKPYRGTETEASRHSIETCSAPIQCQSFCRLEHSWHIAVLWP